MTWRVDCTGTVKSCLEELATEVERTVALYPHEADFMATQMQVIQTLALLLHPTQSARLIFTGHMGADNSVHFTMTFSVLAPGQSRAG